MLHSVCRKSFMYGMAFCILIPIYNVIIIPPSKSWIAQNYAPCLGRSSFSEIASHRGIYFNPRRGWWT